MRRPDPAPVGYVVKRYPRFSETFIVNEILAHEAAGLPMQIFSLMPPCDTHFQEAIAQVRAPVTYLPCDGVKTLDFWALIQKAAACAPGVWPTLMDIRHEDVRDIWQAAVLARHVIERRISHLHAHFATAATSVTRLAARMAAVPYSFTAHAKDIYGPDVRHDDLRGKLADAAAVITVSDYNRAHLCRTYGAAAATVVTVYNGLPLDQFRFRTPRDRAPLVLSVGRLVEKKGLPDLIDACAVLDAAGRTFQCDIIGSGPLEGALQDRIARLGLAARVQLLGPRPRADVIRHMERAAVFAAPCVVSGDGDRDGMPTVLLEAMALGTPAVATSVTGIPELVRHGETGLLVGERNAAELAGALDRLLTDATLRVRLAGAARTLIAARFDAARNAGHVREVFQRAARHPLAVPQEVA